MKKVILMSIFSVAVLCGCVNGNSDKKDAQEADSVTVEKTQPQSAQLATHGGSVKVLESVDQLKATEKPVIIDFNATWCGPCKEFAPHFESVSVKMGDKAEFISVDVDKWQDVAMEFGAQSIPMIVIVKPNGEKVSTVGYMTEGQFEEFVNKNI